MDKIQLKKTQAFGYKAIDSSINEVDETSRIIKGYLASFNTRDEADDILLPGCFSKSIKEHGPQSANPQKIIHLWQHDYTMPLGRYKVLEEDHKGLYFEAELDPIPKADEVIVQYKSGTLNQHSIGYWYIWDKVNYSEQNEAFMVGEVSLVEGSTVTFGCNPNTPFLGFGKSAELDSTILEKLEAEMKIGLAGLPYSKQVELRKIFFKYQSLAAPDSFVKEFLQPKTNSVKNLKTINDFFK